MFANTYKCLYEVQTAEKSCVLWYINLRRRNITPFKKQTQKKKKSVFRQVFFHGLLSQLTYTCAQFASNEFLIKRRDLISEFNILNYFPCKTLCTLNQYQVVFLTAHGKQIESLFHMLLSYGDCMTYVAVVVSCVWEGEKDNPRDLNV